MKKFLKRLTIVTLYLLSITLPAFAGQLDDTYLAAFGEQPGSNLEKAVLLQTTEIAGTAHCGTPLKHELQRDWNQLEPATQKTLAKQLAAPTLSGSESTLVSPSGRFQIHYTTSGTDAVPSFTWVQTVAQTFDDVAASYITRGWNLAPTVAGVPYDVYLRNLAPQSLYGQTTSTQSVPTVFTNSYASYLEIDNDFTEDVYTKAPTNKGVPVFTPLQSLQITSAHEYHHAIQYGYNFFFDAWYAEATSTWQEDELYDAVNQSYNYIPAWFRHSALSLDIATSTVTGGGYSRWIFNRYLAEQHGTGIIKSAWEALATQNSPGNNAKIPMVPVLESLLLTAPFHSTLGADFFGFTKRVYMRDWTNHSYDISLIHPYTPVATVSNFPANNIITLAHYSFAFYKFTPSSAVPTLTIALNKTSGIQTALFSNIAGIISEINANSSGNYTVAGFSSLNTISDEVVLLVANTTNFDNHQASFSTSGSAAAVTEPTNTPAAESGVSGGGGGGGGSCFIATAAYGSYLHPQVQVLRDFRDSYLLTNAPGRAFIKLYYHLSPPAANYIAQHGTLRLLVRLFLTPVIFVINNFILTIFCIGSAMLGKQIRRRQLNRLHRAVFE